MQKKEIKVTWLRMTESGKRELAKVAQEHGHDEVVAKIYEKTLYERVYECRNSRDWQIVFIEESIGDFDNFTLNPAGIIYGTKAEYLADMVENNGRFEVIGESDGYQSTTSDGELLVEYGTLKVAEGIDESTIPAERDTAPFVLH